MLLVGVLCPFSLTLVTVASLKAEPFWCMSDLPLVRVRSDPMECSPPNVDVSQQLAPDQVCPIREIINFLWRDFRLNFHGIVDFHQLIPTVGYIKKIS